MFKITALVASISWHCNTKKVQANAFDMAAIVEFLVTPKVRNLVGYTSAGIVLMWTIILLETKKKKIIGKKT